MRCIHFLVLGVLAVTLVSRVVCAGDDDYLADPSRAARVAGAIERLQRAHPTLHFSEGSSGRSIPEKVSRYMDDVGVLRAEMGPDGATKLLVSKGLAKFKGFSNPKALLFVAAAGATVALVGNSGKGENTEASVSGSSTSGGRLHDRANVILGRSADSKRDFKGASGAGH